MKSLLKFAALVLLLVASGAIGAGIYSVIDQAKDSPNLNENQVYGLVVTYLETSDVGDSETCSLYPSSL